VLQPQDRNYKIQITSETLMYRKSHVV